MTSILRLASLALVVALSTSCDIGTTEPAPAPGPTLTPASPGGLVMYSDAGTAHLTNSWCQQMTRDAASHVTLQSSDLGPEGGTDAIDLNVTTATTYWDLTLWAPDNSVKDVRAYKYLLFDAKSVSGSNRLRVTVSNNLVTPNGALATATLPTSWGLVSIPLSSIQGTADLSQVYKVAFKQAGPGAQRIFLDNIRFSTDSLGLGDKAVFKGTVPAGWGAQMRAGLYYDQRDPTMVRLPLAGLSVRYNYLKFGTAYGAGYIKEYVDSAKAAGQIPSFVVYGGFGTSAAAVSTGMASYAATWMAWYTGLLAEMKAADATAPYVLVIEPDLLGFLVQSGWGAGTPVVGYGNLAGWAQAVVANAHAQLPNSIVGHLVSHWDISGLGNAPLASHTTHAQKWGALLKAFGTGKGDVFFVEKADRDAGYYASRGDANWSWSTPQYQKYLEWIKTLSFVSELRAIPWQVSLGTSGNGAASQNYKDDFAQYFAANQAAFADAGVIGVLFGRGAGPSGGANPGEAAPAVYQTEFWTDGGRFLSTIGARGAYTLP
jgi:hypothetical protein